MNATSAVHQNQKAIVMEAETVVAVVDTGVTAGTVVAIEVAEEEVAFVEETVEVVDTKWVEEEITEKRDEAGHTEDFTRMPFQPVAYCRGEGRGVDLMRVTGRGLCVHTLHEHPAYGLK